MDYIDEGATLPVPFNILPSRKSFKYAFMLVRDVFKEMFNGEHEELQKIHYDFSVRDLQNSVHMFNLHPDNYMNCYITLLYFHDFSVAEETFACQIQIPSTTSSIAEPFIRKSSRGWSGGTCSKSRERKLKVR